LTVDVCAGILKEYYAAVKDDQQVSVVLTDGTVLEGPLHPSLKAPEDRRIRGRTVDLRQAFKQLAPAPAMAPLTVVCIWHPVLKGIRYYLLRALPFGARNAVFAFGATARVLECIMVRLFYIITAQYVDDFPQFETESLVDESDDVMVDVLKLLGWEIKLQEGEAPKFQQTFNLLGVRMHLEHQHEDTIQVSNKPERAEKICKDVERIIKAGKAVPSEIEAMRGALNSPRPSALGDAVRHHCASCQRRSATDQCGWTQRLSSTLGFGQGTSQAPCRGRCATRTTGGQRSSSQTGRRRTSSV
jgi:hypothetical protein